MAFILHAFFLDTRRNFDIDCADSADILRTSLQRLGGALKEIGVVVTVDALKGLSTHSRDPAASQIGTPRCISHVAQVWRNVCGVTSTKPAR